MRIIDISVSIGGTIPTWPGSPGCTIRRFMSLESGDAANCSELKMDVHMGTHVDAPSHLLLGAKMVSELQLADCIGPAEVRELKSVGRVRRTELLQSDRGRRRRPRP